MKQLDGYIEYVEDWYGFYKSIKDKNIKANWLVELALEFYQDKLTELYYQKEQNTLQTMDFDDLNYFNFGTSHQHQIDNELQPQL